MFSAKHQKNDFGRMYKINIGSIGEGIAVKHIINNGYEIIKRNHREKFDEIDIIARHKNGCLVFFEVKTMTSGLGLKPEDNFTEKKFKKIKRICLVFSAKHQKMIYPNKGWRIDLLAINISKEKNNVLIRHYKNVYK